MPSSCLSLWAARITVVHYHTWPVYSFVFWDSISYNSNWLWTHYIVQAGLRHAANLLPRSPRCWDCRHAVLNIIFLNMFYGYIPSCVMLFPLDFSVWIYDFLNWSLRVGTQAIPSLWLVTQYHSESSYTYLWSLKNSVREIPRIWNFDKHCQSAFHQNHVSLHDHWQGCDWKLSIPVGFLFLFLLVKVGLRRFDLIKG